MELLLSLIKIKEVILSKKHPGADAQRYDYILID
jgi:hypothetical protein